MNIQIIRIYETVDPSDGKRILVSRLWSRGICKENTNRNIIWNSLQRSNKHGRGSPSEGLIQCDGYNLAHASLDSFWHSLKSLKSF